MNVQRPQNDIVEIFGYAPNDTSTVCRSLWTLGACPFVETPCSKSNHDKTIVYGTCSVTTRFGDCVICPNRLYANYFATLKEVSADAFGDVPFYTYQEYIQHRSDPTACVVALGMHSGHEIKLQQSCSMDWVLAKIENARLVEYTGIEVQSIDITNNYRDNWYAYKNISENAIIPRSEHGMNWANVHKRLIPQIIRNVITVHTYALGDKVSEGRIREIVPVRKIRFKMQDFSDRFVTGPNLPSAEELDAAIRNALGLIG